MPSRDKVPAFFEMGTFFVQNNMKKTSQSKTAKLAEATPTPTAPEPPKEMVEVKIWSETLEDKEAIQEIVEKIREAAEKTRMSIPDLTYCFLEPVLAFDYVYAFGATPETQDAADGDWEGETLLMNEEGGCVIRKPKDAQAVSLRESVLWLKSHAHDDGSTSNPEREQLWLGRVAELMSPRM